MKCSYRRPSWLRFTPNIFLNVRDAPLSPPDAKLQSYADDFHHFVQSSSNSTDSSVLSSYLTKLHNFLYLKGPNELNYTAPRETTQTIRFLQTVPKFCRTLQANIRKKRAKAIDLKGFRREFLEPVQSNFTGYF